MSTINTTGSRVASAVLASALGIFGVTPAVAAPQSTTAKTTAAVDEQGRARLDAPSGATAPDASFDHMLQRFIQTYKLGSGDEIAVRVAGEPDYTVERAKVSPFGAVYHPLLGDVQVGGLTVGQASAKIEQELAEYIKKPRVSVALLDAHSAKVGVLGDVSQPGIVVMAQPMTVLDAISAAGGFTDFGSKSDVSILRQLGEGQTRTLEVNVKRILEGKSDPYENIALQPGDTVVVHGNKKKTLASIVSVAGFASFASFIGR
jgi:polysaccharide export outer membrane protein